MLSGSLATVVLALLAATPALSITVPLQKRDLGLKNLDGSVNIAGLHVEATRLAKKYERNRKNWRFHAFGEDPTKRNSKRATMVLTEQETAVWTGKVSVGTPAQPLDIYFDSGSSDFTVASSNCPSSSCGTKHRYNPDSSSTSVKTSRTITTNFVDGTSSSGNLVEDTVSAGGLTATGQDIIAASSLSSTVSGLASDGLMGLAYPALSQAFSASLPFTLYQQRQGGRPEWFALSLRSQGTSQITFGGYNRARTGGGLRWFNVKLEDGAQFRTYWQIGASAAYVNGVQASSRVNMILDSGTTLIIAPPTAAATFWAQVPGAQKYDDTFWTYPCNSPPTASFSFARITLQMYDVAAYDFNLGYLEEDPTRCVGAVIGQNLGLGTSWILGDAFMTNWYVIHDVANNRLGLGANRGR